MVSRLTDDELEALVQSFEGMCLGHQRAVVTALRELQAARRCLGGIATCATCEACRGAAMMTLGR